jgi:HEAT repeat protein
MTRTIDTVASLLLLCLYQDPALTACDRPYTASGGIKMNNEVIAWVREAPFDDPVAMQKTPEFSYDAWFARGRAMPQAVETLIEMLEREDLQHPSGDGMRLAYALGWIGDGRKEGVQALLHALESRDITLRVEATAALGRQGDSTILPTLMKVMEDVKEDINVRANACIAIGRIGDPSSEAPLKHLLQDNNPFLATCAKEALRLLGQGK